MVQLCNGNKAATTSNLSVSDGAPGCDTSTDRSNVGPNVREPQSPGLHCNSACHDAWCRLIGPPGELADVCITGKYVVWRLRRWPGKRPRRVAGHLRTGGV